MPGHCFSLNCRKYLKTNGRQWGFSIPHPQDCFWIEEAADASLISHQVQTFSKFLVVAHRSWSSLLRNSPGKWLCIFRALIVGLCVLKGKEKICGMILIGWGHSAQAGTSMWWSHNCSLPQAASVLLTGGAASFLCYSKLVLSQYLRLGAKRGCDKLPDKWKKINH